MCSDDYNTEYILLCVWAKTYLNDNDCVRETSRDPEGRKDRINPRPLFCREPLTENHIHIALDKIIFIIYYNLYRFYITYIY
jgi:hypothetical protein